MQTFFLGYIFLDKNFNAGKNLEGGVGERKKDKTEEGKGKENRSKKEEEFQKKVQGGGEFFLSGHNIYTCDFYKLVLHNNQFF